MGKKRKSFADLAVEEHRKFVGYMGQKRMGWNGMIIPQSRRESFKNGMENKGVVYEKDFDLRPVTGRDGKKYYKVYVRL